MIPKEECDHVCQQGPWSMRFSSSLMMRWDTLAMPDPWKVDSWNHFEGAKWTGDRAAVDVVRSGCIRSGWMGAYGRGGWVHTVGVDGSIRSGWMEAYVRGEWEHTIEVDEEHTVEVDRSIRSGWMGAYGRGGWKHTIEVDGSIGSEWMGAYDRGGWGAYSRDG